ncbi:hypothetical protein ACM55K_04135, partial [Flavobacterium sp. LT1R49]|uniref:hypothetical protein n=1 Tax=Flavobacterium arabinosi TaxID=3398737 RepID=UPI003A8A633A
MKKIISFKIKSMQEYCCTFFQLLNVGFSKFNFITLIDSLSRLWSCYGRQSFALPLMLAAILMTGYRVNAQGAIRGIVPVQYPHSGSGVDGDAFAHEPTGTIYGSIDPTHQGVGDLFDKLHPTIDGHGVVSPVTGQVFYKPTDLVTVPVSYFLQDPYLNDPTIFTLSNKINDNPNTYTWGAGSSPNKNEIQNCGAHFSYGDSGVTGGVSIDNQTFVAGTSGPGLETDLWCLFAGDRQVTNGSSYIDFEFLQAPLTITGAVLGGPDPLTGIRPITGGSGGFTTSGTQGGRTVGDILLTIEFTQGGGDANVVIRVWTAVGSGFEYVVHPNSEFFGDVYLTNNFSTTTVPFDVYGSGIGNGVYAPNQWAEGAINLTQVLKAINNPCFTISTLFIRTRSSGNSAQSELKDFPGAPIQLNLDLSNLAVTCSEPVTLPVCSTTEAITTAYNTWKAGFSNTGGISPVTDNLVDFPPLGNLTCGGQLSFEYKVFDACHKIPKTCTSTFTVVKDDIMPVISALPAASTINCPALPAFAQATATDNCTVASLTFADVTTPGNCPGNYSVTRTWTATDDCGNRSTASQRINVQ